MTPRVRLAAASFAAACLALSPALVVAAPPTGRTGLVKVSYREPKDPAHRAVSERLRTRRVLETFADVLGAIRLPRPLTLLFAGCDGESNAWYEASNQTVTFCYEFVADFEKTAAGAAQYGVSRDDAIDGAVAYVLLHECGHALFDLLEVPVLGREEDAADHVAAWILLRAGKGVARRALSGAAWMYKHDASARTLDESDYSDVHGLDAQRLYNVLCLAYGSDPASYAAMVEKGYLPKDRAEGCEEEYAQVTFAMKRLIARNVDAKAAKRTQALHRARWDAPPAPAPGAAGAPPPPGASPAPAERR